MGNIVVSRHATTRLFPWLSVPQSSEKNKPSLLASKLAEIDWGPDYLESSTCLGEGGVNITNPTLARVATHLAMRYTTVDT